MRYLNELRPLARQAWPDFEDLFERFFAPVMRTRSAEGWSPRIDIVERPEAYVVTAEVAGIDPKDVEVTLTGDTLTIRGTRKRQYEQGDGDHPHVSERTYGAFERTFTFPSPVAGDRAEAETDHGVITIRVPKSEAGQPRKISVKSRTESKPGAKPEVKSEAGSKPR